MQRTETVLICNFRWDFGLLHSLTTKIKIAVRSFWFCMAQFKSKVPNKTPCIQQTFHYLLLTEFSWSQQSFPESSLLQGLLHAGILRVPTHQRSSMFCSVQEKPQTWGNSTATQRGKSAATFLTAKPKGTMTERTGLLLLLLSTAPLKRDRDHSLSTLVHAPRAVSWTWLNAPFIKGQIIWVWSWRTMKKEQHSQ